MGINLEKIGSQAKAASYELGLVSATNKNKILLAMAAALRISTSEILAANQRDLSAATGLVKSFVDRLTLDESRIEKIAQGLEQVTTLPDPLGNVTNGWINHAGLQITQKRVPLGVVGIIYEARPNVTVDAAALCFKSGNAVILRGGKEAFNTNLKLVEILQMTLKENGYSENAIQILTDTSHEVANEFMQLTDYLDVLIPRGGAKLIQTVMENAKVPVIETGVGNCHIYVDQTADLEMAEKIIVNAKCQRPAVCNAAEKLLIHEAIANRYLPKIVAELKKNNVEIRADEAALDILQGAAIRATAEDWDTEYNDYILGVKVVSSVDEAIKHINQHGTKHSETIVTNDYKKSQQFLEQIDAAAVYVNASTRFTDGFEFGFGAEIGISTQKLHARGPMGLEALTTTKYVVRGNGQIRE
ncbi:glutamate-5-semialdehyde dehydrogenase [Lactobacillus sp. UCMA15818]|uniref:glutamate-5-semialdehyde dehydrogenase n=1 Tax=Lactobacillus sp. UCMA15818 TaxID=2583394 RepID=UPI0025B21055|nr:glutamate-5-semialdehyde dehydrogenase [Lactobacillus sp. UCMA15818]MDN2454148.1 glutamate-5-semialdehyde dehydrogenase [Lactobacillus sp. UCMA15818]